MCQVFQLTPLFYSSLLIPSLSSFLGILFLSVILCENIREIYLLSIECLTNWLFHINISIWRTKSFCFSHCSILIYSVNSELEPQCYIFKGNIISYHFHFFQVKISCIRWNSTQWKKIFSQILSPLAEYLLLSSLLQMWKLDLTKYRTKIIHS